MKKIAIIYSILSCILLVVLVFCWIFSFQISLTLSGLRPDMILRDTYETNEESISIRVLNIVSVDNRKIEAVLSQDFLGVWHIRSLNDLEPYNEREEEIKQKQEEVSDILNQLLKETVGENGGK
ncbi:MAG: hypothetical protein E7433_01170 [Ruminococcaceae bacterium]|nr:hypothetical protein [Oscillospiraceae bacterium]